MPDVTHIDSELRENSDEILSLVQSKIKDYKKRGILMLTFTFILILIATYNPIFFLIVKNGSLLSDFFKEGYKASFSILTSVSGSVCGGLYFGTQTKIKVFQFAIKRIPEYPNIKELEKRIVDKVIESLLNEIK